MRTFEQAMEFTRDVSSSPAYEDSSCQLLWATLEKLPLQSTIIEVGCEFGRSTSLLAQATKDCGHELILIDPFISNSHMNPGPRLIEMLLKVGAPFTLHCATHQNVATLPEVANLVHIDGDHSAQMVTFDCIRLLYKLPPGGFAVFHDYGRETLPDVKLVVDRHTNTLRWEHMDTQATCRVMRRIR